MWLKVQKMMQTIRNILQKVYSPKLMQIPLMLYKKMDSYSILFAGLILQRHHSHVSIFQRTEGVACYFMKLQGNPKLTDAAVTFAAQGEETGH